MANRKNLVFLHLESISRANLWQYRNELGTVWRLMSQSLQFNRFFTSSTSTEMTITDVMFGDSSVKDASPIFAHARRTHDLYRYSHIRELFFNHGYLFFSFFSSLYSSKQEQWAGKSALLLNEPDLSVMCVKALNYMKQASEQNKPFIAHFWDASSHLAYVCKHKDAAASVPERLRVAYALVDRSVNVLLSGLAAARLWDDTVIVGFGDHGDEAWSHDLNRGYAHAIPPYASVTWVPAFIYAPEHFTPAIDSRLGSMVDLKPTISRLMFPDDPPEVVPKTPFVGIDLFNQQREYAFSQSMYALQREFSDPEQGMRKGYAVTDGEFRLVVSSEGREPRGGGMELYCDQADPSNSRNLLKFFRLDAQGIIKQFSPPPDAVANHFIAVFGNAQVDSIIAAYNRLRDALQRFVRLKETFALEEYNYLISTSVEELTKKHIAGAKEFLGREKDYHKVFPHFLNAQKELLEHECQLFPQENFFHVKK